MTKPAKSATPCPTLPALPSLSRDRLCGYINFSLCTDTDVIILLKLLHYIKMINILLELTYIYS